MFGSGDGRVIEKQPPRNRSAKRGRALGISDSKRRYNSKLNNNIYCIPTITQRQTTVKIKKKKKKMTLLLIMIMHMLIVQ